MNGDYLSSNAAKMISRRKQKNGDGGLKMQENNERSAEWLRGAVESHINTCNLITSITSATKSHPARQGLMAAGNELHNQLDRYRALLATAEAREGGENLAEISADRAWIDGAKFGWNCETKADLHEAIANRQQQIRECSVVERVNAAVQSVQPTPTQPTAAEVIEACRVALMGIRAEVSAGCHPDAPVEELKRGIHFEPVLAVDAALALAADWEAARK